MRSLAGSALSIRLASDRIMLSRERILAMFAFLRREMARRELARQLSVSL